MPVYGVLMQVGVSASLNGNVLYTGWINQASDNLQSCSAVAFCNTVTHMGGMYHFPSGSINTDVDSRRIIGDIILAVNPNRAFIAYGIVPFYNIMTGTYNKNDPETSAHAWELEQLCSFVQSLMPLGSPLSRRYARGGHAELRWAGHAPAFEVDNPPGGIIDLSGYAAGAHGPFIVYK